MRHLALVAAGVWLAGSVGQAQDPIKTNPKNYHVVLDNPTVRVLHVIAAPGEKTALHDHPDYVTVALTDATLSLTGSDGASQTAELKAGQAQFTAGHKHAGANAGKAPAELLIVELKGSAAPKATLPTSRPNITRKELFDSPRAAAVLFTADAGFKEEPKTTHDYDQVVIAVAPATLSLEVGGKTTTTMKRGDAVFIGRGQPHQAQNTSGKPQELIVVAIK